MIQAANRPQAHAVVRADARTAVTRTDLALAPRHVPMDATMTARANAPNALQVQHAMP